MTRRWVPGIAVVCLFCLQASAQPTASQPKSWTYEGRDSSGSKLSIIIVQKPDTNYWDVTGEYYFTSYSGFWSTEICKITGFFDAPRRIIQATAKCPQHKDIEIRLRGVHRQAASPGVDTYEVRLDFNDPKYESKVAYVDWPLPKPVQQPAAPPVGSPPPPPPPPPPAGTPSGPKTPSTPGQPANPEPSRPPTPQTPASPKKLFFYAIPSTSTPGVGETIQIKVSVEGGTPPYTLTAKGAVGTYTKKFDGDKTSFAARFASVGHKEVLISITDRNGMTESASLGLTVIAKLGVRVSGPSSAQVGQIFAIQVSVTGGTPPYSLTATNLSGGTFTRSFSASPFSFNTAAKTPGPYTVNVSMKDKNGTPGAASLTIQISAAQAMDGQWGLIMWDAYRQGFYGNFSIRTDAAGKASVTVLTVTYPVHIEMRNTPAGWIFDYSSYGQSGTIDQLRPTSCSTPPVPQEFARQFAHFYTGQKTCMIGTNHPPSGGAPGAPQPAMFWQWQ